MTARLRMLLSAYACEPGCDTEAGDGWNWARQLSRFHDVWVITRTRNRRAIQRALEQEPLPCAHFIYFDFPRWLILPRPLHHFLWQIGVYFLSKDLHAQVAFETVHHVNPPGRRLPNFLPLPPASVMFSPTESGGRNADVPGVEMASR